MKSPAVMLLISLACLFAVFHSCHGIRCYFCLSQNYGTKGCEKISGTKFVHDYGFNVENCMKLLIYKNDTKGETRLLFRVGYSDGSRSYVDDMIKTYIDTGYKVNSMTCQVNLCNGK